MPFSATDTIVAIATSSGRGGLGIVRLSGSDALSIAKQLTDRAEPFAPRHATFTIVGTRTETPDHAVVTYFPAPHSSPGDAVVEISVHGSPVVLTNIVQSAVALGARAAAPGEFTLRAFLNGKIDLPQAEAIRDLVDATTPFQAQVAFDQLNGTLTGALNAIHDTLFDLIARLEASVDFPDEGYHFVDPASIATAIGDLLRRLDALMAEGGRGRLVREGLQIAIVGAPNVGKSSLFNALLGTARAIVSEAPGTTRDLVSEVVDLDGLRVTLVDTAGLRETGDAVEAEGVRRATAAGQTADLILDVFDGSAAPRDTDEKTLQIIENKRLIVFNKSDIEAAWSHPEAVSVSAVTGEGLGVLREKIRERLGLGVERERPAMTNVRHLELVRRAREALVRAESSVVDKAMPEEFVLADLQEARGHLEEITGVRTSDDVLAHIFASFCIGK
ncbi:MAG: tRNA uridine-5-carboxymethylaminomethyl(34) synthesis GTPase MnmE [Acidobacteriaceae bacterium]|jgi:tRNA modification GTPase|nr:tRNA uridine-5-carboxymethylaminomethyl(34) synthesis GTPase MnmE [Acidobacteriaceae bacterium]